MVRLVRVSKTYSRGNALVRALNDLSLEVARGEFCAFVGPSGCGKSTLLHLIAGLDVPTSGEIWLDGRSTAGFTSADWTKARRELMGIVFQSFHLVPGLTAEENIALPLLLRGERGATVKAKVEEALHLVGMQARRDHRPGELSGGEQQRVGIARAVVHRPRVLLADEPTGNLDSHQGAEIIDLLRSFPRSFGHTVLLVTHSAAAAQAADYVWTMQDGRLVRRSETAARAGA